MIQAAIQIYRLKLKKIQAAEYLNDGHNEFDLSGKFVVTIILSPRIKNDTSSHPNLSPEIEKDTSSRLNSRQKMKMIQAATQIYRLELKKDTSSRIHI